MSYLRGAGAEGTRVGARDAAAPVAGGELCPATGGGEEERTRGLDHAWIREEMKRVEDFCYT